MLCTDNAGVIAVGARVRDLGGEHGLQLHQVEGTVLTEGKRAQKQWVIETPFLLQSIWRKNKAGGATYDGISCADDLQKQERPWSFLQCNVKNVTGI